MSRYIDADALVDTFEAKKAKAHDKSIKHLYGQNKNDELYRKDRETESRCEYVLSVLRTTPTVDAVPVVRCGECGYYHSEDDPAYCDELCTIHIEPTDGCLRGIKRGGNVGYRAADGERKDGEG